MNNSDFVTIELLSEIHVELEVNSIIQSEKNDGFNQMTSFISYLKTTIQGNILASALGTNWINLIKSNMEGVYYFESGLVVYVPDLSEFRWCGSKNFITPATVNSSIDLMNSFYRQFIVGVYGTIISGFFSGCTPLESILESTLDCLYQIECLQLLLNNFPKLNQVRIK